MLKFIVKAIAIVASLYIIGFFPALTVAATAVGIVMLFLFFGKE